MTLRKELTTAAIAILALTLALGVAYPLAITGIGQVAFPGKANGDRTLIARPFEGARYFHPRPSQTDYSASASAFSNRGPNQASAKAFYAKELAAYLKAERPYSPGLTAAKVPADAVMTSASGIDPQISPANARIQARRVAAVRRLPLARVDALVQSATDGRFLGVIGEPGINVDKLNAALDKETR
jgi:potassium-transporting ATPase KdpC subunit